ncbi:MAG TPA: sugar ABC transporter permease [Anaerolineales bacterium]|nr:sugar ABC transporter permease [Anaerolineales bacterium]
MEKYIQSKSILTRLGRERLVGRRLMILLAVVPVLIFYGVWFVIPIFYSLTMSFFDWNPLATQAKFLGLANYVNAFTQDPLFWVSLRNTLYYMLVTVPVGIFISLIVALLINSLPRWVGLYRLIYFIPVVTSMVAVSIVWKALYQTRFGLINQILQLVLVDTLHLHINAFVPWLSNISLAMPSIMIMSIWKNLGFTMVLFLAGLTSIPKVYYDAAMVDGAGRWDLFRHITFPLLQPTMVFVTITGVIGALQEFTPMYVMTSGGPVNATKTIVFALWEQAFKNFRFGYASALAFILFIIIMALTLLQWRMMKIHWEY